MSYQSFNLRVHQNDDLAVPVNAISWQRFVFSDSVFTNQLNSPRGVSQYKVCKLLSLELFRFQCLTRLKARFINEFLHVCVILLQVLVSSLDCRAK